MNTWIGDLVQALKNLGGFGHYSAINAEVKKIRKKPLPLNWSAVIRRTIQQHSSDSHSFLGKKDLFYSVDGIGHGVWGLREFFPEEEILSDDFKEVKRIECRTNRIIRDSALSAQLKQYHSNTCQICGKKLKIGENKYYSEGHHIKPLGEPHNGPDTLITSLFYAQIAMFNVITIK